MTSRKVTFTGHDGQTLAARLDEPQGETRSYALFAHCFTCGKDIAAARRISQRLAILGIGVLRFDFTGLGHSEGEFANTTFSSNVEDLRRAAAWMADQGMAPQLLIGHSLGGAAILKAAGDIASARAVVTIGAPFDPGHVTQNFAGALDRIEADGAAEVQLGAQKIRIGQAFVEDVAASQLEKAIHDLKKPLLVLHAPRDTVVGIDNATQIFRAALHPKSFVSLDKSDHLVTEPEDAEYAASVISAWAQHYLNIAPPPPPPGVPEGVTRVSEADPKGFQQDIVDLADVVPFLFAVSGDGGVCFNFCLGIVDTHADQVGREEVSFLRCHGTKTSCMCICKCGTSQAQDDCGCAKNTFHC